MISIEIKDISGNVLKKYDLLTTENLVSFSVSNLTDDIRLLYDIQDQKQYLAIMDVLKKLNKTHGGMD